MPPGPPAQEPPPDASLFGRLRDLPRAERYAAVLAAGYLFLLLAAYACYLALGHTLLGWAYVSPWLWEPRAELDAYREAADLRVHRFLFVPLLLGLPLALGLLVWAFRRGPLLSGVTAFWHTLPRPHRFALTTLVVLLFAGQAFNDKRALFPFARWGMYGRAYEPDRMRMYDLYGVTPSGERTLINIGRTLPSIQRGAPRRFTETARVLRRDPPAAPTADEIERLDEAAVAIAAVFERLHGVSFAALEVVEETVYVDEPRTYRRASEVVRTIPLRPSRDVPTSP
jgi:hypothetical protein